MTDSIKERLYGLFFGQIVGDALGTRYEFMKKRSVIAQLKKDISNDKLKILGGGPFGVQAGQYTDDSELVLGVWYSILTKQYDLDDIAKQFYSWYASKPFDIGRATETAFSSGKTSNNMISNAKNNEYSMSNGCLMKISPIGALNYLFEK